MSPPSGISRLSVGVALAALALSVAPFVTAPTVAVTPPPGAAHPARWVAANQPHLTVRLGDQTLPDRLVDVPGGPAFAVLSGAEKALARADDVVRMVLAPDELTRFRQGDHVEVVLTPPATLTIAALPTPIPVARLLVPLTSDQTSPDWFVYVMARPDAPYWEVYRQRGAPPAESRALREAVAGFLGSPGS